MTRGIHVHILLIILLLTQILFSQNQFDSLWKNAITAYEQKKYDQALEIFQQIEKTGKISDELYYNIANCYYKLSKPGLAILYYERALLLNPADPDIRYNLELVRKQLPGLIKIPPKFFLLEWWDSFFNYVRFPVAIWIFLITFFIFNLLFALGLAFRKHIWSDILLKFRNIVLIILVFELLVLIFDYRHDYTHQYGIITSDKAAVHSEPFEESTVLYYVVTGQKVELLRKIDQWQEVLLPDGNKGWIRFDEVVSIDPTYSQNQLKE